MKPIFSWLFKVPDGDRSILSVVAWWEIRRIPYNIFIGLFGLVCLLIFYFFIQSSGHLQPGEDAVEPMALFIAPILINFAYTAGWVTELISRGLFREQSRLIGPKLLKAGILFSVFVVSLPSVIWGGIYLWDKIK